MSFDFFITPFGSVAEFLISRGFYREGFVFKLANITIRYYGGNINWRIEVQGSLRIYSRTLKEIKSELKNITVIEI